MAGLRAPVATYRLQLRPGFGFAAARALVPYLRELGVSHVYAPPIFAARSGSEHGYDVIDPTRLNPELGSEREFRALAEELRRHEIDLMLDIVPNHMSASDQNPWWKDVLSRGEASHFARYFDVDWEEADGRIRDWRDGPRMTNYRRFFAIDDLVGVRVEDPAVFDATHALAIRLMKEGVAGALRIDHIDGLYDPLAYLHRIRREIGKQPYVVVEKIVSGSERLPDQWPVQGTTGYDFLNALNSVFVDAAGHGMIETAYRRFARRRGRFADVVYERKRGAAVEQFVPEFRRLARKLTDLAEKDGPILDEDVWREALVEVSSCLPVYRTYARSSRVGPDDEKRIAAAVREARRRRPTQDRGALRFLRRVLLLDEPPRGRSKAWLRFVMQWQQITGGAMAKGLEDSALYRYVPLASMNEVDADPKGPRPASIEQFHLWNIERLRSWPDTMNATSTHDTKRSEDVRARMNVLSEIADEWSRAVRRWRRMNAHHRSGDGPCASEEWLLYQTLVGAWPLVEREIPSFRGRVIAYMIKAARESAEQTSWAEPDEAYERGLSQFVEALFHDEVFLGDLRRVSDRVAWYGMINSLSQVVLKVGSPGVPDIYQGNELWDLSLVDPDNRRPVDFATRAHVLQALAEAEGTQPVTDLWNTWRDGRIKLHVTAKALAARSASHDTFARGEYVPIYASSWARRHIVAFARRRGRQWAIIVAPRFPMRLAPEGVWPIGEEVWKSAVVRLPERAPLRWRNAFTGERVDITGEARHTLPLAAVLGRLPVALLVT